MTIHQPTAAVRESFGQAQQQAAAMVAGPPTPWNEATRAERGSARWLGIAAVSVAVAGVAGWFAADWLGAPVRTGPAGMPKEPVAAVPATPAQEQPAVVSPSATAPVVSPAALTVTRQGGMIRIDATNAPLADAVRALAQATRTTIQGDEALAVIGTPVTLHWQGTDIAAAWDALLGRFASIGVSCRGAGCDVWIVGVTPPPAATPRTASAAPGMAAVVADQPAAAEVVQPARPAARVEPPPPATDENTETN
jgi:hypothetical protein